MYLLPLFIILRIWCFFRKCRNEYWRFHTDLAAVGSPYTAACTGRNSLPSASQTQETIHYIVKCSGNVLYIGHHIFLQGLRCYMGKTSFCSIIALATWFWGYKWGSKVNFKTWLWILVLSFSILHIINYDLSTMDIDGWIRVVLKEAVKIPSALMFSYVRIKHGFGTSVALHFAVNLSAYFLERWCENIVGDKLM